MLCIDSVKLVNTTRLLVLLTVLANCPVFAGPPSASEPTPEGDLPVAPMPKGGAMPEPRKPVPLRENWPTPADIPAELSADVKAAIQQTFAENPYDRIKAVRALFEMKERAAPAAPFLIRLLNDEAYVKWEDLEPADKQSIPRWAVYEVRAGASVTLEVIGKPAVEPCLAALRRTNALAERDSQLIRILATIKDPGAVEPLIALLGHPEPDVRKRVIDAISTWNDRRWIQPLVAALKDSDPGVRRSAATRLEKRRDSRIVPALLEALDDKEEAVRDVAIRALGEQRDPSAAPVLLTLLRDKKQGESLRQRAAVALGKIEVAEGHDALLALLKDTKEPEGVRESAAWGLAETEDLRFVEPLIQFVKEGRGAPNVEHKGTEEQRAFAAYAAVDPIPRMRGKAIDTLGRLGGERARTFLAEVATDEQENEHVRCHAAVCLVTITNGALDDERIVDALSGRYWAWLGDTYVLEAYRAVKKALNSIAENGKTDAIREAAKTLLKKRNWNKQDNNEDPDRF